MRRGNRGPQENRPTIKSLYRDTAGATAVEFAIVSLPFILVLLVTVQMGVLYVTQSALDIGVTKAGGTLISSFYGGGTPNLMSGAALKSAVVSGAGGMINNDATLAVEIRQLTSLDTTVTPIVDGTTDYGGTTSILVLRARANAFSFAPGFPGLTVYSSLIMRRRGT